MKPAPPAPTTLPEGNRVVHQHATQTTSPHATGRRSAAIMAGSLLAGLAAAAALVAGPFAGDREPVITGALLLGFAVGWALLAVLSARFTDRPQRWALLPAGAMAATGAGLIALAPRAAALTARRLRLVVRRAGRLLAAALATRPPPSLALSHS